MNEREEHEWLLQERARVRARSTAQAGAPDGDADERAYAMIAHELRMPADAGASAPVGVPADFAATTAHAIIARRVDDRRARRRFERRVLGALVFLYAGALVLATAAFAAGMLPELRAHPLRGAAWIVVVALLCATGIRRRHR